MPSVPVSTSASGKPAILLFHDICEGGKALLAEIENSAAHEKLQIIRQQFRDLLTDAQPLLDSVRDEALALKADFEKKVADATAAAVQARHDEHNAAAAPVPASSPTPADPAKQFSQADLDAAVAAALAKKETVQ